MDLGDTNGPKAEDRKGVYWKQAQKGAECFAVFRILGWLWHMRTEPEPGEVRGENECGVFQWSESK